MERDAKKLSWKTGVTPLKRERQESRHEKTPTPFLGFKQHLVGKMLAAICICIYIYAYNVCIYVVVWQSFSHPVEKDAQVKIMIFIISPGINMTQIVETRNHHLQE